MIDDEYDVDEYQANRNWNENGIRDRAVDGIGISKIALIISDEKIDGGIPENEDYVIDFGDDG